MNCREKILPTRFGEIRESGPERLLSDQATQFLLDHFAPAPGDRVAEIGCGTGVLSMFAAFAGAREVIGTDTDPLAIATAKANAARNGLQNLTFCVSSLLEAVSGPLDCVIGNLPHRPSPQPWNPRFYGGPDGTDLLLPAIRQSEEKLIPGGRLILYVNGIANPNRVMSEWQRKFSVTIVQQRKRYFTQEEFDGLLPGMFEHLRVLHSQGKAEFFRDDHGYFFWGRILEGRLSR